MNGYPSGATFINAIKTHEYLSADKLPISVGDTVYQLSKIEGLNKLVLRKFNVEATLSDGRINIKGSITVDTTTHNSDIKIAPHTVYKDAISLIKQRLVDIKYQLEVELPELKNSLEEIWINLGQDPNNLEVGKGLNETMEI